ncbi:MAG: hypothetical protein WC450_05425, partial [Candidatus Omnitrophota bacterium]
SHRNSETSQALTGKTFIMLTAFVVIFPVSAWLVSEFRWDRINSPEQKFSNVNEYLALKRMPDKVVKSRQKSGAYYIAFSPMDTWFALPSGPAAYVFNDTGILVDWTADSEDDPAFYEQWLDAARPSTLAEMVKTVSQSSP